MLQSFYLNHFQVSGSVKLQLEAPADTVISEGPYRTKAFQIEGTKGKIIVPQGLFPGGTDVSSIHTVKLSS